MPVTSNWIRGSAESKLSTEVARTPDPNSTSADTCVGTATGNTCPALGPDPTTRSSRARAAEAATRDTPPNSATSAVR